MRGVVFALGHESLADRESGAAVRQPDLDHDNGTLFNQHVTQDIAVLHGERDTLKVTRGSRKAGTRLAERTTRLLDRGPSLARGHPESMTPPGGVPGG
ncbi:MAG: hypothetical protein NVS3B21_28630 [Acidimicrobiales bacterium]